jgi:RNA polymerase sigma-70 factor (ECF subfamily)
MAEAEDVTQEALTRAWLKQHACSGTDPLPWVLTIVRREAWRAHDRRRDVPHDPASLAAGRPAPDGLETVAARLDLQAAMASLNAEERAAVLLRYGCDMTQPAVAEALETPEGTVKVRLHRARHQLRRELSRT